MAPLNNEEILASWRALGERDHDQDGWRSIPIVGLDGNRLHAARRFPGNCEAVLASFGDVTLPVISMLPSAAGFRVERISTGMSGNWLALVRREEGGIELFSRMAVDVVSALSACKSVNQGQQLQLFLGRVRAWQHFMSRDSGALGPEAELGLSGELHCLELLLDRHLDAHAAVKGWRGPLDALQDFELGTGAIEVKSTLSQTGFPATIMSLEQLDDAIRKPLFLFACRFSLSAEGITLAERIEALRSNFASDAASAALFESALLHAGFVDTHAEHYTRRLLVSQVRCMQVEAGFPRLVSANVPDAIRNVRYEINCDAIAAPDTPMQQVLEMIGAI
ncbi:hypothetical protein ASF04_26150 [Duganella sp. Leaf61]|uniref:MZA anti-phage system associated PD-(D/E)XK motif protein MzaD n=1 Tax=Duganella sp. Leaf61 TaxID=1736227 RepID=UPI0006FD9A0A|nr:MZA anti-phage system associated PD-(D/E)XK motif protein MzaD [Duganella sp. Leaf61]KQN74728.1 hypothetical protein ASF04_26150 [Duganella sp. Leaf61]